MANLERENVIKHGRVMSKQTIILEINKKIYIFVYQVYISMVRRNP